MKHRLTYSKIAAIPSIELPASKSISNRLLIAQKLGDNQFEIENLSDAEDTRLLSHALHSGQEEVNVGMAGTAFRFLSAYYALCPGKRILTGAERIKERPIKALVNVLHKMGAKIEYLEKEGHAPLKIEGNKLKGGTYRIDSSVSSQFISSLLLISPYLEGELILLLDGNIVSSSYIKMTLEIMKQLGAEVDWTDRRISVKNKAYSYQGKVNVERDWSSASFFYQMVAFGLEEISLKGLSASSIQGDQNLQYIYDQLGVESTFVEDRLVLKRQELKTDQATFELGDYPDLIPSVVVTVAFLFHKTIIKGTKTLHVKESDRVTALKTELRKLGITIEQLDEDTILVNGIVNTGPKRPLFDVHNDHRIAMCLAPLCLKYRQIDIQDTEVVSKSFPLFWEQLRKVGMQLKAS